MNISDDLQIRWFGLEQKLMERFDKKPDVESVLFLIGIQELGDIRKKFTKEQKQDLMHIATCKLFSLSGYYEFTGRDADGWPHYQSVQPMPNLTLKEQEQLIRWHILEYFEQEA